MINERHFAALESLPYGLICVFHMFIKTLGSNVQKMSFVAYYAEQIWTYLASKKDLQSFTVSFFSMTIVQCPGEIAPLVFQRFFHDRVVLDVVRQSDHQSRIPLHSEPDGLLGVGVAAPGPEHDIS